MKKSNKSLIICIFVIIILIIGGYLGYKLGTEEERKNKDYIINNNEKNIEDLRKEGYINVSTRYYILERKINGKWYQIEPIGIESKKYLEGDTLGISLKTNVKYNIFKDFSEYTKKGLPKGKYRIIFISHNIKENNSKSYIGKEFEIK